MRHWTVSPDDEGRVWLTALQAAWLARTSTETVQRWIRDGQLTLRDNVDNTLIDWASLCARARSKGGSSPAHWRWLNADLELPPPTSDEEDSDLPDAKTLHKRLIAAEAERDIARAEAENLDQAVMAYRDSWRRRTQPQGAPNGPTT